MENAPEKWVVSIASSSLSLDRLIKEAKKLPRGTIQIFDPNAVINRTHLCGAYADAIQAFKNGTNIAKDIGMETLLFTAMTNQIKDAIKIAGAKTNKRFVLFCSSDIAYKKIRVHLKTEEFKPSIKESLAVAKKFGIIQSEDLDKFVLQKMAVSRLQD